MKNISISHVSELLNFIENLSDKRLMFRGEPKNYEDNKLKPSLYRNKIHFQNTYRDINIKEQQMIY